MSMVGKEKTEKSVVSFISKITVCWHFTGAVFKSLQWRRQDFVTGGSEVWVYRGSRVRSPSVPVVKSVYQRGSFLDGLAMYLSCDTKKFHDNESTHISHNFCTSTHRGEASRVSAY